MSEREHIITRILSTASDNETLKVLKDHYARHRESTPGVEVSDPHFLSEASVSKARVDFHIHNLGNELTVFQSTVRVNVRSHEARRARLQAQTAFLYQLRLLEQQLIDEIESASDP